MRTRRPTVEHAGDALEVGVADHTEGGVPETREFGSRTDGSEDEPGGTVGRGAHLVGDAPRDRCPLVGQFTDAVGDVIVAEIGQVAAEGIGFHRISARLEVGPMDLLEDVGPGVVEDLVTTLETCEIVECEVGCLQHGPHRAVADQHAARHGRQEGGVVVSRVRRVRRHGVQSSSLSLGFGRRLDQ